MGNIATEFGICSKVLLLTREGTHGTFEDTQYSYPTDQSMMCPVEPKTCSSSSSLLPTSQTRRTRLWLSACGSLIVPDSFA